MSVRRIGDREREAVRESGRASRLSHLRAAIATPLGVLTIVPLLVAAVGLLARSPSPSP